MTTRTSQDVGMFRHMIVLALALFRLFVCCVSHPMTMMTLTMTTTMMMKCVFTAHLTVLT